MAPSSSGFTSGGTSSTGGGGALGTVSGSSPPVATGAANASWIGPRVRTSGAEACSGPSGVVAAAGGDGGAGNSTSAT